jgi:cytochrome b
VSPDSARAPSSLVWDLPVRIMHWALVVAVIGSWLTQEIEGDYFVWHVRCGYAVLGIAIVRLLWGFIGTRHARFRAFVRGPRAVLQYTRSLMSSKSQRVVGHNPLGGLAIVAMLGLLLAQAITGLFANDQIMNTGPLFGYVTASLSDRITGIHEQLFDVLVALIALHIVGYWILKRDNLIVPMITGRKDAAVVTGDAAIESSRLLVWLVLAVLVAGGIYWIVSTAPEASLAFF